MPGHAEADGNPLAEQVCRDRTLQLPQAVPGGADEQTGEKAEQGHVDQIDPAVEGVQAAVGPDLRLNPVAQDHQKEQKPF